MDLLLVAVMGLIASTLSGVTGFGGSMIMLPILTYIYGVKIAIPILTVTQLYGNLSRAFFGRKQLDWTLVGCFSLGSVPASVFGARIFTTAPTEALYKVLGVFLLPMCILQGQVIRGC